MSNYIQLKKQIEKLQKEAEILRKQERTEVIANIKEEIVAYGLTTKDLGLSGAARGRKGRKSIEKLKISKTTGGTKRRGRPAKETAAENTGLRGRKAGEKPTRELVAGDKRSVVAPKYRDAATGATWTGRGKQPKWLATALENDRKLEDFKI